MPKLYANIAGSLLAHDSCMKKAEAHPEEASHWQQMADMHAGRIEAMVREHLPSGGGFDCGTRFNWERSRPERLVFDTDFHHMNDGGYYDGWSRHSVTVTPSLVFEVDLKIGGRDRNDIKDYIHESFQLALTQEVAR